MYNGKHDMNHERYNQESFPKPFCPDADLLHWLFAIDLLERHSNSQFVSSITKAVSKVIDNGNTPFDVVWKSTKFNNPTGLCLNGPIAGYYVSKWHERYESIFVVKGRSVSIDGGTISVQRALTKVERLETMGIEVSGIKHELLESNLVFPRLLASVYVAMGYPIDVDAFVNNALESNLYWDNNNNNN